MCARPVANEGRIEAGSGPAAGLEVQNYHWPEDPDIIAYIRYLDIEVAMCQRAIPMHYNWDIESPGYSAVIDKTDIVDEALQYGKLVAATMKKVEVIAIFMS